MKTTRIVSSPFFATITLGLQIGYSKRVATKISVIKCIQEYQEYLIQKKNLYLSVSLSECNIVLSGQVEPHLKLNFINYPKFPLTKKVLKREIENMTKHLMEKFEQNRIVLEYNDETVMLEKSTAIDPRIVHNK